MYFVRLLESFINSNFEANDDFMFKSRKPCANPGEGGAGGSTPPLKKSKKYRVSEQYWSGSPE